MLKVAVLMWMPVNIPKKKIWFLDNNSWPVEKVKGHPVQNLIRLLLHTRRITTKWSNCATCYIHGTDHMGHKIEGRKFSVKRTEE